MKRWKREIFLLLFCLAAVAHSRNIGAQNFAGKPVISADASGNLFAVWQGSDYVGNNFILAATNSISGTGWSEPVNISSLSISAPLNTNAEEYSCNPVMAIDSTGNVYVAWVNSDPVTGNNVLWCSVLPAATGIWMPPQQISSPDNNVLVDYAFNIIGSGLDTQSVFLLWRAQDITGTYLDIYVSSPLFQAVLGDYTLTWPAITNLTNNVAPNTSSTVSDNE